MKSLVLPRPAPLNSPILHTRYHRLVASRHRKNLSFRVFSASSSSHQSVSVKATDKATIREYNPNFVDDLFLKLFRSKLVEEVGWDSEKSGYDGLIEVANLLMMKGKTNSDTKDATVRILKSLFPSFVVELFRKFIVPIESGKVAAVMVARVTAITCQWLMGTCTVNSVDLPDGSSWNSGVLVEKCKYLEESKCLGICVNTCKLPTQTFFKDCMGVPLLMEPNYIDYSCQFKFGITPPSPEDDVALKEPCLEICPNASRRRNVFMNMQCPKA